MILSHQACPLVWFSPDYRSQLRPKCQSPSWVQAAIALLQITLEWLWLLASLSQSWVSIAVARSSLPWDVPLPLLQLFWLTELSETSGSSHACDCSWPLLQMWAANAVTGCFVSNLGPKAGPQGVGWCDNSFCWWEISIEVGFQSIPFQ